MLVISVCFVRRNGRVNVPFIFQIASTKSIVCEVCYYCIVANNKMFAIKNTVLCLYQAYRFACLTYRDSLFFFQ